MLIAAGGMMFLTRISPEATYVADILPGLLLVGAGLALVFAPAMATATNGVRPDDAGVASATVNTMQQIGGSIGTALLSTVASGAVTAKLAGAASTPAAIEAATIHGYTTAFWWAAAIFAIGAVISGLLLRPGAQQIEPAAEPVLAH